MKELKKIQEFFNRLDAYEDNVRTKDIKETLNKVSAVSPYIEKTQNGYNIIYEIKDLKFKFNTKTQKIEITKIEYYNNIEEITKTTYEVIFGLNFIHIISNSVVNCYTKNNEGYNLLLSGIKLDEYFTDQGFQTRQTKTVTYCPNIIYRSNEDKEYCNFVSFNKNDDGFIYVNTNSFSSNYGLSGINSEIKANPQECNNFVVIYKDQNHNNICFPAFYNIDKTLAINVFLDNPLLQYSGMSASEYNSKNISFEGRTAEDFFEFEKNRKEIFKNLMYSHSSFKPLDNELNEIIKKLMR